LLLSIIHHGPSSILQLSYLFFIQIITFLGRAQHFLTKFQIQLNSSLKKFLLFEFMYFSSLKRWLSWIKWWIFFCSIYESEAIYYDGSSSKESHCWRHMSHISTAFSQSTELYSIEKNITWACQAWHQQWRQIAD